MRASFQKDFKVAKTVGKGGVNKPGSPIWYNNQIVGMTLEFYETHQCARTAVFKAMWQLCLICANQRKLIAKVRGDSNDFFNYATMCYLDRWKKQFGKYDARRPVQYIQNWIPYILGTIRFALIQYNKDQFDYDFLPLPKLKEDEDGGNGVDKGLVDETPVKSTLSILAIKALAQGGGLHSVLLSLPAEFRPYLFDILYYIRTKGMLMTKRAANFVKLGKVLLGDAVERWVK